MSENESGSLTSANPARPDTPDSEPVFARTLPCSADPRSRVASVPRSPAIASPSRSVANFGCVLSSSVAFSSRHVAWSPRRGRSRRRSRRPPSGARVPRAATRSPRRRSRWSGRDRPAAASSRVTISPVRLSLDDRNAVRMSLSGGERSVAIGVGSRGTSSPTRGGPSATPRATRRRPSWSAAFSARVGLAPGAVRSAVAVVDGQRADRPDLAAVARGPLGEEAGPVVARVVAGDALGHRGDPGRDDVVGQRGERARDVAAGLGVGLDPLGRLGGGDHRIARRRPATAGSPCRSRAGCRRRRASRSGSPGPSRRARPRR